MRSLPLMIIGSIALALSFTACAADAAKKAAPADKKAQTAPDKAKDPVCGMTVDTKTAEKATYEGKTYYFCSREEKTEFEKNPAKYAKK